MVEVAEENILYGTVLEQCFGLAHTTVGFAYVKVGLIVVEINKVEHAVACEVCSIHRPLVRTSEETIATKVVVYVIAIVQVC